MPLEAIFSDAFVTVVLDRAAGLVVYRRSAMPYRDVEQARASFAALSVAAARLKVQELSLLIDVREVTGRNDPEFEELLVQVRARLFAPFRKRAVLVRTAVGALQLARLGGARTFHDEAEALAYLG